LALQADAARCDGSGGLVRVFPLPVAVGPGPAVEEVVARVEADRRLVPWLFEIDVPPRQARGRVVARKPERMCVAEPVEHEDVRCRPAALAIRTVPLEESAIRRT